MITSLKADEYIHNKGYDFLEVGAEITGKSYDRILIDFMELTPANLMWLAEIMSVKQPPVLPTMPEFLRQQENVSDHLLRVSIKRIRNKE